MEIKEYEIIETEIFKLEKRNIIHYIYYNFNLPNVAKRKYKKINKAISTLDNFPERCPKVFENNDYIRKLIFDNYIIIYKIKNDTRTSNYFTYI